MDERTILKLRDTHADPGFKWLEFAPVEATSGRAAPALLPTFVEGLGDATFHRDDFAIRGWHFLADRSIHVAEVVLVSPPMDPLVVVWAEEFEITVWLSACPRRVPEVVDFQIARAVGGRKAPYRWPVEAVVRPDSSPHGRIAVASRLPLI